MLKKQFFEEEWALLKVDRWAQMVRARVIRCIPTARGMVVYYLGG